MSLHVAFRVDWYLVRQKWEYRDQKCIQHRQMVNYQSSMKAHRRFQVGLITPVHLFRPLNWQVKCASYLVSFQLV